MARLSELRVWIADCQTTGASPAHGAVLEIAWGHATAACPEVQGPEAHWVALPPGLRVGARVRQLTGFDEVAAAAALPPSEVWARLRDGLGSGERVPAAIHFAKFELAFLRDWAARFEPSGACPVEAVCLHAIAARLYPELPRQSLRALAGYLGHGLELTRRSAAHVEATAFIWRELVRELAARGVDTWAELSRWLQTPRPRRRDERLFALPPARRRGLPAGPGVYRFLRADGRVLYVGKAKSLDKRVRAHFTAGAASTPRALEMLVQVHDVAVTPTASALEAALLESDEIKALGPVYNLQLTRLGGPWFVDRALGSAAPRPSSEHRLGPLPYTSSVLALGAVARLAQGEAPELALRARAVESPERWAPDEAAFAAGHRRFLDRHGPLPGSARQARRRLAEIARTLLAAPRPAQPEVDAEGDPSGPDAAGPGAWDPERVLRHLERAVAQGHQLLTRARWLCLLCDSVVVFLEPGAERPRQLDVRAASLADSRDAAELGPPRGERRLALPLGVRQACFERSHYDRLRTLTTELDRVQRDGGAVTVRVAGHALDDAALRRILRWV